MRFAAVPEGAPLPRSVAACLAAILEADDVPVPAADHPEPWTVWRNWLAQRGLGLVPVLEPQRFSWPGPWIALLGDEAAGIAYGAPPGLAWAPLGEGGFEAVTGGYVVAPLDAGLWAPKPRAGAPDVGRVEALAVAAAAEAPMRLVERVLARAGRGLEGDRYFDGRGTFSNPHSLGHQLTLIDAEAIEGLLAPADARRNIVTRGIDLNALVGRRFTVGQAECVGRRLCEPCAHLQRLTEPGVLRALVHIGGLRADVLSDGEIRVGDELRTRSS